MRSLAAALAADLGFDGEQRVTSGGARDRGKRDRARRRRWRPPSLVDDGGTRRRGRGRGQIERSARRSDPTTAKHRAGSRPLAGQPALRIRADSLAAHGRRGTRSPVATLRFESEDARRGRAGVRAMPEKREEGSRPPTLSPFSSSRDSGLVPPAPKSESSPMHTPLRSAANRPRPGRYPTPPQGEREGTPQPAWPHCEFDRGAGVLLAGHAVVRRRRESTGRSEAYLLWAGGFFPLSPAGPILRT